MNKMWLVIGVVGVVLSFAGVIASWFMPILAIFAAIGFFLWWLAGDNIDNTPQSEYDEERGKDRPVPD